MPRALTEGWSLALTPAGACLDPEAATALGDWIAAPVPGTAALALAQAGRWRREAPEPLHDKDVWYRVALPASGRGRLRFDGLATLAEVWLDDRLLLASESMFQPQEVDVDLTAPATLWICFRALLPRLEARGPRARWRPRMIERQGLRLVRTTLLGHMPGWCPSIDIVGPWRPVSLVEPEAPRDLRIEADWRGGAAWLEVSVTLPGVTQAVLTCAGATVAMTADGAGRFTAALAPDAEPWWPHTHGDPPLYAVTVTADGREIALARTGFRSIEVDRGPDGRGFGLTINGEPVFCRGASWIAPDLVGPGGDRAAYEPTLRLAREAGMNMVRISGVGLYETPAFFEVCDELGLLVWQDFMFANFDYPAGDPAFAEAARREARAMLLASQASPSLAVLCGGSEVMQQATMMGLPADLAWPLYDELLAGEAARLRPDVPYVPNTPYGGPLPFVANEGVAHYYGVGAYERPLEDARRAEVRFASECLAFANVPAAGAHERVPRDRGASWDFADTGDHYLGRLFGLDPVRLRREDLDLHLDLSRAVSGEVMAAVFSEWRRARSPCAGGLVWTFRDLEPGAGWGVIDAAGQPKPCWHALKRVLQPLQVLLTDEGVNGLAVHLINEGPAPVDAELRLVVFGEEPGALVDVKRTLTLAPRSGEEISAFDLMGRFFDVSYAYRFGPRAHAATFAQLIVDGEVASEATIFASGEIPAGDVQATVEGGPGAWRLVLESERLCRFVRVADAGFRPSDDWLCLAPGEPKVLRLMRRDGAADAPVGELFAPGGRLLGSYRAR